MPECRREGEGVLASTVATSQVHYYRHKAGFCTNGWDLTMLNENFVMLDLSRFDAPAPAKPLPLRLHRAPYIAPLTGRRLCRCAYQFAFFASNGFGFLLRTWTGTSASAADKEALRAAIASVRTP
jgi:hypothetical protein